MARAVVQKAQDLYLERKKAEVQAIGVSVGNAVARQLARLFRA